MIPRFSGGTHLCSTLGITWDGVKQKHRAVFGIKHVVPALVGFFTRSLEGIWGRLANGKLLFFLWNFMSRNVDC